MKKYRLTESNLRDIIREAVNETLMNEGNFSNSLKKIGKGIGNAARKGYKFAKEKYDKFGKDIEDLTNPDGPCDNPMNPEYYEDNDEQTNESRLRGIIREAVKSVLNEDDGLNRYKGFIIYDMDPSTFGPKIDICIKKGWSKEQIQNAIDSVHDRIIQMRKEGWPI